jgi:hypothetical protein
MGRLSDDLHALPKCELIGGPFDGAAHPMEDHRDVLPLRGVEHGMIDTYRREPGTNKFRYQGRTEPPSG